MALRFLWTLCISQKNLQTCHLSPSIPARVCQALSQSQQLPKEVLNEIIGTISTKTSFCYASDSYLPTFFLGFMARYWDQAYKGSILTEQQVKEAVKVPHSWRSTQERKRRKRRCWPTRHRHHLPQELPILLQFQLLLQRPSLLLMFNYLTVIKSPSGQVVF
jgi:hypothetical protein